MESQKVGCNWVNEQWEGEGFLMNPNAYRVGQKKGGLIPTLVVSYFGQSLWPSSLTAYVLYFQLAILSFMGSLKSWKSILFHSCIFWHHTEHHSRAFGPCLPSDLGVLQNEMSNIWSYIIFQVLKPSLLEDALVLSLGKFWVFSLERTHTHIY